MNCPLCGDHGIVRMKDHEGGEDEFAICLCAHGMAWRSDRNAVGNPSGYPKWLLWAAREQVNPALIVMVEDVADEADLARIPQPGSRPQTNAIADAMRTRRARL